MYFCAVAATFGLVRIGSKLAHSCLAQQSEWELVDADRLLRSDCADVDCWIGGPEGRPFLLSCVTVVSGKYMNSSWEKSLSYLICVLFKYSSQFVFEEILFSWTKLCCVEISISNSAICMYETLTPLKIVLLDAQQDWLMRQEHHIEQGYPHSYNMCSYQ